MSFEFNKIGERSLLSEVVHNNIEDAIRDGNFEPGTMLPSEKNLAEQFGVSRTAIREALRMLSARGLISIKKGKGAFVNKITADLVSDNIGLYLQVNHKHENYVKDLIHARQMIEPSVAYNAAIHRTDEDVRLLEGSIESLKESGDGKEELSRLDMEFHMHIAHATKNSVVPLSLKPILQLMLSVKKDIYVSVDDAKGAAIELHSEIVEKIKNEDPESAYKTMTRHLEIAEDHLNQALDSI